MSFIKNLQLLTSKYFMDNMFDLLLIMFLHQLYNTITIMQPMGSLFSSKIKKFISISLTSELVSELLKEVWR